MGPNPSPVAPGGFEAVRLLKILGGKLGGAAVKRSSLAAGLNPADLAMLVGSSGKSSDFLGHPPREGRPSPCSREIQAMTMQSCVFLTCATPAQVVHQLRSTVAAMMTSASGDDGVVMALGNAALQRLSCLEHSEDAIESICEIVEICVRNGGKPGSLTYLLSLSVAQAAQGHRGTRAAVLPWVMGLVQGKKWVDWKEANVINSNNNATHTAFNHNHNHNQQGLNVQEAGEREAEERGRVRRTAGTKGSLLDLHSHPTIHHKIPPKIFKKPITKHKINQ